MDGGEEANVGMVDVVGGQKMAPGSRSGRPRKKASLKEAVVGSISLSMPNEGVEQVSDREVWLVLVPVETVMLSSSHHSFARPGNWRSEPLDMLVLTSASE